MEWNRSTTLALSNARCAVCEGNGLRLVKGEKTVPCKCVLRNIFRACYTRFRRCVETEKNVSRVSFDLCNKGKSGRIIYGRKNEEYMADFWLVARRTLAQFPFEFAIFRYHYLLGADWKLCCRKLNIDRGNFFHACYRLEQILGRVFAELRPYPLYPLDEYFSATVRDTSASRRWQDLREAEIALSGGKCVPIRPPVSATISEPVEEAA